mgnify:CR=1 FL=1
MTLNTRVVIFEAVLFNDARNVLTYAMVLIELDPTGALVPSTNIQSARLMTIHCAEVMESGADARTEISSIKVFVPAAYHRVVDRAIQVFGAKGVSGDTPLAGMYMGARTLRLADGPDEVHRILIAKNVLRHYHNGLSWDFGV